MPIHLITGLPGNGKTLYTISQVREWSQRENRQVYYHGIPELTLDWVLLEDPKEWAKCPPGSIVVLDEAQKIFRNRSMGAQPPQYVADLETHRHLGIDLVFITQHPALIDPSVRRLAARHEHMVRINGSQASTVHRWESVKDNCDKSAARKDSEKKRWKFDKSIYSLYKSAEVHTVKAFIPGRYKLLAVLAVLLVAMAWYFTSYIKKKTTASDASSVSAPAAPGYNGSAPAGGFHSEAMASKPPPPDPVADAQDYVFKQTPRVTGLPYTAPKYDQITIPTRAPVPAMCVQIGSATSGQVDCRCYTQQATRIPDMEFNMCLEFARNGHFQDFDAEPQRQEQRVERSRDVISPIPDVPLRENYGAPQVIAFNELPETLSPVRPSTNPNNGPPNRPNVRTANVPAPAAP